MKNKSKQQKKESFLKREFLRIKSKIKNGPSHVYALLCWQKMGEAQQAMGRKRARQANKTPKRNPVTGQKDHFGTWQGKNNKDSNKTFKIIISVNNDFSNLCSTTESN